MANFLRFVASITISAWGSMMVLLGFTQGEFLWVAVGGAVATAGIPLLASNPLAAGFLYPEEGQPDRH